MRRTNPFASVYAQCNMGEPADKWAALPPFPRLIDIEVTAMCNMRCRMCPTGIHALGRPQGFMTLETYGRILGECTRHGTALRLIGWGEPLLHPEIVQMVQTAHACGVLVHINTNGTKLDGEMAYELVQAGLASIKISFQGVDGPSYAAMRRGEFLPILNAVRAIAQARLGTASPFIAVSTSVTDESPERIEQFRRHVEPLCDQLTIGNTIFDFLPIDEAKVSDKEREAIRVLARAETGAKRHPVPCPEVYDKLSIHWDGTAHVCCNDFAEQTDLGNVNETPIAQIWRHPEIEAYRGRLARKEYTGPLCSVCFDYAELTEGAAS